MIAYAKSYTYFLMHSKDIIKMCKACKEYSTAKASRITTKDWYKELAGFFYFNMVLPVPFLHKNTIAKSLVLPVLSEVTKYNGSETFVSLF